MMPSPVTHAARTPVHAPFFIVGCPRSGTTLLQTLIDMHPEIAIPPESHLFERFAKEFNPNGHSSQPGRLRRLVKAILNDVWIRAWNLKVRVPEFWDRVQSHSVRGVLSCLFELYCESRGKTMWGEKTPTHVMHLSEIRRLFPDARYLHMVRDGRDVAESFKRVYFGAKSISRNARRWQAYLLAFLEFKRSLPAGLYYELRYEDLVRDPQSQMEKVFAFLGVEPIKVEAQLPASPLRSHYVQAAEHHRSLGAAISEERIQGFKTKLTPREIEIFESVAGGLLRRYQYPLLTSGQARIKRHEQITHLLADTVFRYGRKLYRPRVLQWDLACHGQLLLRKLSRGFLI